MDSISDNSLVKLKGFESEIIPQQKFTGESVIMDLPVLQIDRGFYEVIVEDQTADLIAFNSEQRESLLAQKETDELLSLFAGNIEIIDSAVPGGSPDVLYAKYQSTPLWKYAILLAIGFIIAEVLLFKLMK